MHEYFIKELNDELLICKEKPPLPNFDFKIYHQYYKNNDNKKFKSLYDILHDDSQISTDYFLVYSTLKKSNEEKMINVNSYLHYLKRIIPTFYYPVSHCDENDDVDLICIPFNRAVYLYDYITMNEPYILGTYLENGVYTLETLNRKEQYIFDKTQDNNLIKRDVLNNEYLFFVSTYLKYEFIHYKKISRYIFFNRLFLQTELFINVFGKKEKLSINDYDISTFINIMKNNYN